MTEYNTSLEAAPEIRVLLIDDSKSARRACSTQLSAAGFTVFTSTDGFTALSDCIEHRPHIIVADIIMPRLDGYQLCALIKHSPDYHSTPVVLVSSRDGLFDRARGRLVVADAHLAKPVSDEELIQTLKQCLQQEVAEPSIAREEASVAETLNADETWAIAPV